MNPVLQDYDLLEVSPYRNQSPTIGDVICFFPHDGKKMVIQRIIGLTKKEYCTQGDNAPFPDPMTIKQQDIVGQVIGIKRDGRHHRIFGGYMGGILFRYAQVRRTVKTCIVNEFVRISPHIRYFKRYYCFLPDWIRPRPVIYTSLDSVIIRLFVGKKVIGWYHPYKKKWLIRYPFQLFFDPDTLPITVLRKDPNSDSVLPVLSSSDK